MVLRHLVAEGERQGLSLMAGRISARIASFVDALPLAPGQMTDFRGFDTWRFCGVCKINDLAAWNFRGFDTFGPESVILAQSAESEGREIKELTGELWGILPTPHTLACGV